MNFRALEMSAINLKRYPLESFSIRPLHSREFKNFFRDLLFKISKRVLKSLRPPLPTGPGFALSIDRGRGRQGLETDNKDAKRA
jgi:hypothetical protein